MRKLNGRLAVLGFLLAALIVSGSVWANPANSEADEQEVVIPIDEVHRGQHVILEGTVRRIADSDEFVLEDDSGRIRVYIGWKNRMPVSRGERVKVWGVADDDAFPGFRPEIYARTLELASGRKIELFRAYD